MPDNEVTITGTWKFTSKKHKVNFVNYDQSILQEDREFDDGETPVYEGETPTKPADDQNTYEFSGWKEVKRVEENDLTGADAGYDSSDRNGSRYQQDNGSGTSDGVATENIQDNPVPLGMPQDAALDGTDPTASITYPATLTFEGGDYTVTATFDETAALPADTSLYVTEILPETICRDENETVLYADYDEYYNRTLRTLEKEKRLEDRTVSSARFFDIIFANSENYIVEPAAPVTIAIQYKDALSAEDTLDTMAVHFDDVPVGEREDAEIPEIGKATLIETEATIKKEEIEEISFDAKNFSVYAIVGTGEAGNVYDNGIVSVPEGDRAQITFSGETTTHTVASTTSYTWEIIKGGSCVSINGPANGNSVTVNGLAEGNATLRLTYKYKYINNGGKEKDATDIFHYTIQVTPADTEETISDDDATAATQNGSSVEGLTVSVKATGNWRKLSADGYYVAVEDAGGDYTDDILKAYHIYLAKEDGTAVTDEELANTGNANLQVTLTYDAPQNWLRDVTDIKHYKNKEEAWISTYSIDNEYKTVRFNVHGFSDFVFVNNPDSSGGNGSGGSAAGSGDKYLISKTASETDVENEYDITLTVKPSITWPKKSTPVYSNLKEIMEASGIWIVNSASLEEGGVTRNGNDGTIDFTNYTEIKQRIGINGGANGSRLLSDQHSSLLTFSAYKSNQSDSHYNGSLYEVTKIVVGTETITLDSPWYCYEESFSNNTCLWFLPNGNYLKLNCEITIGNDQDKINKNCTLTYINAQAITWINTYAEEYVYEDDVNNWANATIAKPKSVTDPMGNDISFLKFAEIDGQAGDSNPVSSSFSSASYADTEKTITWTFSNTLLKGSSENDYYLDEGTGIYYLTSSQYELKYRVRLDVQNADFQSANPLTTANGEENWYDTNGETVLFDDDGDGNGDQTFEVPKVAGILYDLKLSKVDDAGNPVPGAVFELTGSGNNGAITYGSSYTVEGSAAEESAAEETAEEESANEKKAITDDAGVAVFSGLPWGTYTVHELSAPDGYVKDEKQWSVTLGYKTDPGSLETSSEDFTHLMYSKWETDGKFTDPRILVDLTIDKKGSDGSAISDAAFTLTTLDTKSTDANVETSKSEGSDTNVETLKTESTDANAETLKSEGADTNAENSESESVKLGSQTMRLDWGKEYTFTETTPPAGYQVAPNTTIQIRKDENGNVGIEVNGTFIKADPTETTGLYTCSYTIVDPVTTIPVKIVKEGQDGLKLTGAVLSLKKEGTEILKPDESSAIKTEGETTLAAGKILFDTVYEISESEAPEGYNKLAETIRFKVLEDKSISDKYCLKDENGGDWKTEGNMLTSSVETNEDGQTVLVLHVKNSKGAVLPETGGTGFLTPLTICVIMAIAFALATAVMYSCSTTT